MTVARSRWAEGSSKDGPKWVSHNLRAPPSRVRIAASAKVRCSDSQPYRLVFLGGVHALGYKKVRSVASWMHELDDTTHQSGICDHLQPQAPAAWTEHLPRFDGLAAELITLTALEPAPLSYERPFSSV
jgi:hypothetical protein